MSTSRYVFTQKLNNKHFATSEMTSKIFGAADNGSLASNLYQIQSGERLDHIAFKVWGDATLWWIIAAASGIGWPTQLVAGTYVRIPTDLSAVYNILKSK